MKNNIKILRERFIAKICKERGWSSNNLTSEQMKIIVTNPKYINPSI